MSQKIRENVPGPLKNPKDFLRALQGLVNDFNRLVRAFNELSDTPLTFAQIVNKPTTLSGYGIVDAAPLHHRHDASDIDNLPSSGSGPVAWSSITGKPFTVDGFGIIDASKIGHKHPWSDLLDHPTTLAGYGIVDASPAGHNHDDRYYRKDELDNTPVFNLQNLIRNYAVRAGWNQVWQGPINVPLGLSLSVPAGSTLTIL